MTKAKSLDEKQVFGPCKRCNSKSQRSGECWLYDLCSKCYNRTWHKALTCKGCGITSNHTDRYCWKEFTMCVRCAVKNHPDKMQKNQVSRFGKEHGIKFTKPSRYEMCPECNVNVAVKLRTNRLGANIALNAYYCVPCRIIIVKDTKMRIILPMEAKL